MKKILGILLTAVMLLTSMNVLATGTDATQNSTLVWAWDFEEENVGLVGSPTYPKTQVQTTLPGAPGYKDTLYWEAVSSYEGYIVSNNEIEGATAASGSRMMQIVKKSAISTFNMSTASLIPLEKNTWYKFSYKYATTDGSAPPYVNLAISEMENITSKNWVRDGVASTFEYFYKTGGTAWSSWNGAPNYATYGDGLSIKETYQVTENAGTEQEAVVEKTKYTKMAWNSYEIYFMSKNADTQHLLIALCAGKNTDDSFFDDLKLEKINGNTVVNFSKNTGGTSNYLNLVTNTNAYSKGEAVGRTVGKIDDTDVVAYPFQILRKPALEMDAEKVVVSVAHLPKTSSETITLLVGQYVDLNGDPKLINVWCKPITYNAATKKAEDGTTVTEYYYAENAANMATVELNGLQNTADSYLKAYVIENMTTLRSVGGVKVLPAAK